jgi:hypothetical protein
MKHLLNERFFEIAKEYAVNNPKMQADICFERANDFLEVYEKLIMQECERFSETATLIIGDGLIIDSEQKLEKYTKLKSRRADLLKLHRDNFLYRNKQRYIDSIIPKLDF